VITAPDSSWIAPFSGLSPRQFGKLITALRREGADPVRKGRPWSLPLEDRVLLVAAYWRTNLTMRQLAPLFGVSKSAADRIIDHLEPALALQQRKRFRKDSVLIVDGTLVPTRDHSVAEQSKNYRYSTNHQVVIDADTRLVVAVGQPLPGNRNDCKAWDLSGAKAAVDRIIDHLGPLLALQARRRFAKDTVLIVDGTLVPTRDHEVAEQSKNYRYSTNHQVVIDADTRLVVVVGQPLPGNRNDCKAWAESGAKAAVGHTTTIADGGYPDS
jgi:hypothetical protein